MVMRRVKILIVNPSPHRVVKPLLVVLVVVRGGFSFGGDAKSKNTDSKSESLSRVKTTTGGFGGGEEEGLALVAMRRVKILKANPSPHE